MTERGGLPFTVRSLPARPSWAKITWPAPSLISTQESSSKTKCSWALPTEPAAGTLPSDAAAGRTCCLEGAATDLSTCSVAGLDDSSATGLACCPAGLVGCCPAIAGAACTRAGPAGPAFCAGEMVEVAGVEGPASPEPEGADGIDEDSGIACEPGAFVRPGGGDSARWACPLRPRVTARLVPTARVPASVALRIEQPEPTPLRSQSHRGPHSCAGDGLVFLRQAFEPMET